MKANSSQRGAQKRTLILICVNVLLALFFLAALESHFAGGSAGKPKHVAQLLEDLKKRNSRLDQARQAVWTKLPEFAKGVFPFVMPTDAGEIRRKARSELVALGPSASNAVTSLTLALNDPSPDVCASVAQALGSIGPPAKVATYKLLSILNNPTNKNSSGTVVGGFGTLRSTVVWALGQIAPADKKVTAGLIEALEDSEIEVRFAAAQVVVANAHQYDERVRTLLLDALNAADPWAKSQLIRALRNLRPQSEQTISAIIKQLDNGDYQVEVAAVEALSELRPTNPDVIAKLLEVFLRTKNEHMPTHLTMFSRVRMAQTISVDHLLSNNWGLHRCVIRTLGTQGPAARKAIPLLAEEYQNKTNLLRFDAAVARWRIDGQLTGLIATFQEGLEDQDVTARELVIACLREISKACPESMVLLVKALRDPEMRVRVAAIDSLAKLGTNAIAAVPALRQLENDQKIAVRFAANCALDTIQRPISVPNQATH